MKDSLGLYKEEYDWIYPAEAVGCEHKVEHFYIVVGMRYYQSAEECAVGSHLIIDGTSCVICFVVTDVGGAPDELWALVYAHAHSFEPMPESEWHELYGEG